MRALNESTPYTPIQGDGLSAPTKQCSSKLFNIVDNNAVYAGVIAYRDSREVCWKSRLIRAFDPGDQLIYHAAFASDPHSYHRILPSRSILGNRGEVLSLQGCCGESKSNVFT